MSRKPVHDKHAIWQTVLTFMSEGDSLTAALKKLEPAPSYWWAKQCLREDSELRERYQEACEDRADVLADQITAIADEPLPEGLDGKMANAWIMRKRLQVDVRRWAASKLRPRYYGDRIGLTVGLPDISIKAALDQAMLRVEQQRALGDVIDVEPEAEE